VISLVSTILICVQPKKNAVAPQIFGWKLFEVLQIPSEMFGHKSTPHIVSEGVGKNTCCSGPLEVKKRVPFEARIEARLAEIWFCLKIGTQKHD
jgi:hypothetical protein